MKLIKYFLLILLLSFSCYIAKAQFQNSVSMHGTQLDTNMVVYDENNNALHYYQYQKLLNTGNYTFVVKGGKPDDPTSKRFLKKITAEEKLAMYDAIKPMIAIRSVHLQEGSVLDVKPLLDDLKDKHQLENKAIVLIFWNVDCPPCTESFSAINDFFEKGYNPDQIVILAVTADGKRAASNKLKEKPLNNALILSNASDVISSYELKTYPAYVVTNKEHVITFAAKGNGPVIIGAFKGAIATALK